MTPEQAALLEKLGLLLPKLEALLGAPAPAAAAPAAPAAPAPTTDTTPAPAPAAAAPAAPPTEEKKDGDMKPDETKTDAKKGPQAVKQLTQEEQERIVNDSIELRDQARKALGDEYNFKGKANRDVMIDVVKHVDSKFELGSRSEDYLRGRFESALEQAQQMAVARREQHLGLREFEIRKDSKDEPDLKSDNDFLMGKISA